MGVFFEVERAGRSIDGAWIWRDISLRVEPGCRVGLIGPSGAGKSLFLRALAGLDDIWPHFCLFFAKEKQQLVSG